MIDRTHALPVARPCQLLELARSTAYYQPNPVSDAALALMRRIDELQLQYPFAAAPMLRDLLCQEGHAIGRRQVVTLMRRMGITALYRNPRTSQRHPAYQIYPYLLRQLTITRPNHVWATDTTYIPMRRGVVYLCAILDWASRRVLSWRLSNTVTSGFCVEAVQEAVTRYGPPEIFNTDQDCQFTSQEFTGLLHTHGIQISMDGTGGWRDNVFVERWWRSLKYEEVYLHAYETIHDAQQGVTRYMTFYNQSRPHRALDGRTPDRVYYDHLPAPADCHAGIIGQAPLMNGKMLSKEAEPPLFSKCLLDAGSLRSKVYSSISFSQGNRCRTRLS
ncbi:MAG: transposase [Candidatus Nitrospira kreftii]|uniref:Transposase n=1 Tax=Candidatus Nitrospira kreftii TaxID=2652173 RepID=A0A7S8IYX6_9BACT|nr:MAG: transposase [Candidatus Nitrospira kreftii]